MPILFENHATTVDNDTGLFSGYNRDPKLSKLGEGQAYELGLRIEIMQRQGLKFEGILTADTARHMATAELANQYLADNGITPLTHIFHKDVRDINVGKQDGSILTEFKKNLGRPCDNRL